MLDNLGAFNESEIYLWVIGGLVVFSVILFIMLIVALSKIKKIQNRYEIFMKKDNVDLEQLLIQYANKVEMLEMNQKQTRDDIHNIQDKMIQDLKEELDLCIKKVGMIRYKAIKDVGADLSFAIALLDNQNDGVVINGIYGRDGSYTYAKPIEEGTSKYTLSEEEEEALKLAQNKQKKNRR